MPGHRPTRSVRNTDRHPPQMWRRDKIGWLSTLILLVLMGLGSTTNPFTDLANTLLTIILFAMVGVVVVTFAGFILLALLAPFLARRFGTRPPEVDATETDLLIDEVAAEHGLATGLAELDAERDRLAPTIDAAWWDTEGFPAAAAVHRMLHPESEPDPEPTPVQAACSWDALTPTQRLLVTKVKRWRDTGMHNTGPLYADLLRSDSVDLVKAVNYLDRPEPEPKPEPINPPCLTGRTRYANRADTPDGVGYRCTICLDIHTRDAGVPERKRLAESMTRRLQ